MSSLAGTKLLTRLNFRRDRVMVPFWIIFLTILAAGTASSSRATYSTLAKRLDFAASLDKNPSLLALYGPVHNASSVGSVAVWKVGGLAAGLVGVISLLITFLVIVLVLYLVNMLPVDGRAKQIIRIVVVIIGILSLLRYIGGFPL